MINRIQLAGFKSIRTMDLKLERLNVLIGANGAGKSNFISVFRFLSQVIKGNLQLSVGQAGGADSILHHGRRVSPRLFVSVLWDTGNEYRFTLVPTAAGSLIFANEHARRQKDLRDFGLVSGHAESLIGEAAPRESISQAVYMQLDASKIYHFHDTSDVAKVKQLGSIQDNWQLASDGSNLAALLYRLRQTFPESYDLIVRTIRLAAPFFKDFLLAPNPLNSEMINLQWLEVGSETPFTAYQLSDGTLRFMCLAALLLQPAPLMLSTLVLDEPELGLHPYAITLLAAMLQKAAAVRQVIIATQSVPLVNEFSPEDLIVVDRAAGRSVFQRLDTASLSGWLETYTLGQLWQKNVFGGRPHSEPAVTNGTPPVGASGTSVEPPTANGGSGTE